MAQILVPTSDQATGSWGTTPLWSKVDDDSSVNPTGDGVEITSDNNTSDDTADFKISSGTDPTSSTGHILRARWYRSTSGNHNVEGKLELWEGVPGTGTLRATLTSAQPIETSEVEDTYTLSGAEADAISDYTNLYLRLVRVGGTGGPPGGRESLIADLVEFEIPDAAAPSGRVDLSWTELETPHSPTRADLSWVEFEVPNATGSVQLSWAELQVADTPTRADLSWAELETPHTPSRVDLSWVELETPHSPTRVDLSWAEMEAPDTPTRTDLSWAEFEAPSLVTEGRIELSWVEFETPHTPSRVDLSWAELEAPHQPTRIDLSWVELEVPHQPTRVDVSWVELELPHSPTRLDLSWAEFQVPNVGGAPENEQIYGNLAGPGHKLKP